MRRVSTIVFVLVFMTVSAFGQSEDEVLMTIGDEKVTVDEFLRIYNKNNNIGSQENKKSVEEYLDLFINFKLKVIEAENRGLDTLKSFKEELDGYRDQLAAPYLRDDSYDEQLMKEAYERMQKEVKASHIMVKIDENALPEDTLAAWNKIMNIRKRAINGESFEKLAAEESDDPSAAQNGGHLGYFGAFRMVYPFESAAFNTPVGVISMPVRTRFGYHIIKVHDKRPAQGSLKVAHIMAATPEEMTQEQKDSARLKILKIHQEIMQGADFGQMASKHSDDRGSGRRGGVLQWFSTGQMVPEFEMAAFALDNDGDISPPIRTKYGWHIIKRLEHRGVPPYETLKEEIARKIKKDQRSKTGEQQFIDSLKKQYGFNQDLSRVEEFYSVIDSSVFRNQWDPQAAAGMNDVIFTLDGKQYTQKDFAEYIASTKTTSVPIPFISLVNNKYREFVNETVMEYEKAQLDDKYPEYRYLMEEYHDGILLFNLTDELVWSKAVEDTAGLEKFHEANMTDYMWDERVKAAIYTYSDAELTKKLSKLAKKRIKKDYSTEYMYEKLCDNPDSACFEASLDLYEKGDHSVIDDVAWEVGVSEPINDGDKQLIVAVHEVRPPEPKKLNEARGMITADYQGFLEKQWISELRDKYTIQINDDVLNKLVKNQN
jgi:peptidyl-prolyl cis-trans isomerase SurA